MPAPIDAIASHIAIDLGLGVVGTSVFKQHLPDQPDDAIVIVDTGGGPPTLVQHDDTDSPSWQIRSRSLSAQTCMDNLLAVFQALHGLTETTLYTIHFKLVWALQSNPVPLGRDDKQRFQFVQNFRALVKGVPR